MKVHVFSNNRSAKKWFAAVERSKKHDVEYHGADEVSLLLKAPNPANHTGANGQTNIWYIDVAAFDAATLQRTQKRIDKSGTLPAGYIDTRNQIDDPATLFHAGACDYIARSSLSDGVPVKRIEAAAMYWLSRDSHSPENAAVRGERQNAKRPDGASKSKGAGRGAAPRRSPAAASNGRAAAGKVAERPAADRPAANRLQIAKSEAAPPTAGGENGRTAKVEQRGGRPQASRVAETPPDTSRFRPTSGWEEIEPGAEYTFWLAYLQLDNSGEFTGGKSNEYARGLVDRLRRSLGAHLYPAGAREWMWKGFGGVFLFPFSRDPAPLIALYRVMLNQNIINAEDLKLVRPHSFRLALDIGNTVYRRSGETGTIISDAVNFIFHLGQKFTPAGTFNLTSTARHYAPLPIARMTCSCGRFEDRSIYTLPVPHISG